MTEKQSYTASPATAYRMRPSRVLRKIADGGVARVLKLNTFDVKVAEIFAQAQPDAIWLCQEHTATSLEAMENQIRAAKIYDVDTLVRVARGSYSDYIRPLEADATGLIVPHVMSAADARAVRDMTKFTPLGRRAVDGGNNDAMYTRVGFLDYIATANKERFVCYQIEDPEALDEIEAIAEIDGVDALFFGPGDYSMRLGIPGEIQDPQIVKVRERVAEVARRHGKIAATVAGKANVKDYVSMGYNLLNIGADVLALSSYADDVLSAFDGIGGN